MCLGEECVGEGGVCLGEECVGEGGVCLGGVCQRVCCLPLSSNSCVLQSEPKFDQLVGEDEGQSVPSRSSSVTFSPVIEVRHRKSWSE